MDTQCRHSYSFRECCKSRPREQTKQYNNTTKRKNLWRERVLYLSNTKGGSCEQSRWSSGGSLSNHWCWVVEYMLMGARIPIARFRIGRFSVSSVHGVVVCFAAVVCGSRQKLYKQISSDWHWYGKPKPFF